MSKENRSTRYRAAMMGADHMTVRQICEKAGIPAEEAKFVSSGLDREVKVGRAEKGDQVVCPVTSRKSITYKLIAPIGVAAKTAAAPVDPADPSADIPEPKKKTRTVAKRRS